MNMHGFMTPVDPVADYEIGFGARVRGWLWMRRWLVGVVLLPSLLVALYLFAYASDQYESEAHFLVRTAGAAPSPPAGLSAALSMMTGGGGGGGSGSTEAMSVADYLTSHDAVDKLRREDHLVERFHRPGVDLLSRLNAADPTPERLLRYYAKQIHVTFNQDTGITVIKVHSFTPQDSYDLARRLIEIGEQRVNMLNQRSYADALANARRQLAEAEQAIAASDAQMTAFRRNRGDIDPQASGQAQISLVSSLNADLARSRAQLSAMRGVINPTSPQYRALAAHVEALQGQVSAQSGRLTGNNSAIGNDISGYQGLMLRRDFLSKRYESAAASLEKAREQAQQQQLYLVRVVDANMPVKAMFPERFRILGTVVVSLLLIYSIGWLIVAGVREHAA